jgi:hypothetical protein
MREPDKIIGTAEDPYMLRWYIIPRNKWFNIYLHNIKRSDEDRALHDHPWWNISLVLKGGYFEVVPLFKDPGLPGIVRFWRKPGSCVFRWPASAHRLEVVDGCDVWTLFITGRRIREWGFWCGQRWVDWRTFVDHSDPKVSKVGRGCD